MFNVFVFFSFVLLSRTVHLPFFPLVSAPIVAAFEYLVRLVPAIDTGLD